MGENMIKRYSFTGASTAEALAKAKEQLGEDFAIETTKQIRAKTLNQAPLFEVIVCTETSVDEGQKSVISAVNKAEQVNDIKRQIEAYTNMGKKARTQNLDLNDFSTQSISKQNQRAVINDEENADEDVSVSISRVANEISQLAKINETSQSPAQLDYNSKMRDIEKKVDKLSDKLSLIADAVWEDKAASRGDINIPPEFATIYKRAASSGMRGEHLKMIMDATIANMPTSMKNNPAAIERYFYFLLEKMLPSKKLNLNNKKQKIIMLIGPTGVGKTTTLSKLAYKYAYEKQLKTGVITLDSYRIGAVEQLAQYTQVMKMRMAEAINVDDFKSAIKSFNGYDVVLVDTVGSSQYDQEKLEKLNEFLEQSEANIEVNLVLSAGTKIEDLLEIYNSFSFANISSIIVTKLDETKILGNIFSLIYETNIPASYFCLGQNVPDDIMEANSAFLVKCVLEGYNDGSSK